VNNVVRAKIKAVPSPIISKSVNIFCSGLDELIPKDITKVCSMQVVRDLFLILINYFFY
jgi:hypothetical protein